MDVQPRGGEEAQLPKEAALTSSRLRSIACRIEYSTARASATRASVACSSALRDADESSGAAEVEEEAVSVAATAGDAGKAEAGGGTAAKGDASEAARSRETVRAADSPAASLGMRSAAQHAASAPRWRARAPGSGGGVMGLRTQAKLDKREKLIAAELAKKAKVMA